MTMTTTECTCHVTEHNRGNDPGCPVHRDPRGSDAEERERMDAVHQAAGEIDEIRRSIDRIEASPRFMAAANRRAAKVRQTFVVIDGGLS